MSKDPKTTMMVFHVPDDKEWLSAIGTISLCHAHLDYSLRMLVKTLAGVNILEALDATTYAGSRQLRQRINKLARKRLGEGPALVKLQAMLHDCKRLTNLRNEYVHSIVAKDIEADIPLMRGEDHSWKTPPNAKELHDLALRIERLANSLSYERLNGFLAEALNE